LGLRILILGPSGQIGHELALYAKDATGVTEVVTAGRSAADILMDPLDKDSLSKLFTDVKPDIVINAIAYTAVDKAETDQQQAFLLNSDLPGALADHCGAINCLLIHYSTDFVFDGSRSKPWSEEDQTFPLSVYGRSKLAGEKAIQISTCTSLILRTSWVYGEIGDNFLLTMLRLGRERKSLSVVNDQVGSPSCSHDIALATLEICRQYKEQPERIKAASGIYHLSASGNTNWYEFAKSIFDKAKQYKPLLVKDLLAISTAEYPTDATRPAYSVLNCQKIKDAFGIEMANWNESLTQCLKRLNS